MNKLLIGIIVMVLIASGVYFFIKETGKKAEGPDEIIVGYNADQSAGPTANFGVWGRQGFEIAVEEINAKGGILGKQIKTVILDDKAAKKISKANMGQLIFQDHALAVIGPANS